MVFNFVTGQDLCTGKYFSNAIPVVRFSFPSPNIGAFNIYAGIADRSPDRQAGIPHGQLVQHHLRIARIRFSCTRPFRNMVVLSDGSELNCCTVIPQKSLSGLVEMAAIVSQLCFRY